MKITRKVTGDIATSVVTVALPRLRGDKNLPCLSMKSGNI